MFRIANDLPFKHVIVSNADVSSVRVLSHPEIQISEYLGPDYKTVAPVNANTNNVCEICTYYIVGKQEVDAIVVDSHRFPERTAQIIQDNFFKHKLSIIDVATHTTINFDDELTYLYTGYQLTPGCADLLHFISRIAVKHIPLTFTSAKDLTFFFLKDAELRSRAIASLELHIAGNRQMIENEMDISALYNRIEVSTISEVANHPSFITDETIALKAHTGVGKTKYVFSPIACEASVHCKVVYISHLIALVNQFCECNNAVSYQSKKLLEIEQANSLGLVINSLHKPHLQNAAYQCDVLIIDEFEKVLSAVTCSDNSHQMDADLVFDALCKVLKGAKKVIVGDADLSELSLDFLTSVRGELTLFDCTENPYIHIKSKVQSKVQFLQNPNLKSRLLSDRVFLFDSLKTLKQVVIKLGYTNESGLDCEKKALEDGILIVHGDNKDMDEQAAFLKNPNAEIKKYKAIIASPCLGSGFSIEEDYTNTVHIICDKTLNPRELINFARRFRCAKNLFFAVQNHRMTNQMRRYDLLNSENQKQKIKNQFKNKKQKQNFSIALSLVHTLKNLGFAVRIVTTTTQQQCLTFGEWKKDKKKVSEVWIEAVVNSPCISNEQYSHLNHSNHRTSLDLAAVQKYRIKKIYLLESVTHSDVLFDTSFNRELFRYLPFTQTENKIETEKNYDLNRHNTARVLHSILLKKYDFNDSKSKLFIHQFEVVRIANQLYKQRNLINCYLGEYAQIKLVDTPNKATRMIRPILISLGLTMGKYGGLENKARISLSKNSQQYLKYLNN